MPGTPLVATPPMADATAPAPQPGEHSDEIRAEFAGTKLGTTATDIAHRLNRRG
jgi:hypothetical protein